MIELQWLFEYEYVQKYDDVFSSRFQFRSYLT